MGWGYYSEGRRWLQEALTIDGRVSPEVRAMALAGVGWLALQQSDFDRAEEACEEGLALLANETREASEAKLSLLACSGWMAWEREEHDKAKQLFEEGLALSQEINDTWWIASSLLNLALVYQSQRDFERATELLEESMDLNREQGDKQGLASCLNNLGMVVYSQGDLGGLHNSPKRQSRCSGSWVPEEASQLGSATWGGCPCSKTIWAGLLNSTEKASPSHGRSD